MKVHKAQQVGRNQGNSLQGWKQPAVLDIPQNELRSLPENIALVACKCMAVELEEKHG